MSRFALTVFLALLPSIARADDARWVQFGPNGTLEARVATAGAQCPDIVLDGHASRMAMRATATPEFPLVCSASLPAQLRHASIGGMDLTLPVADPQRILVLGDTGCRIKGSAVQSCNDPAQWPFAKLAASAATLKPDLVVHLGDYLYRENACPADNAGCQGTPFGDNWPTWAADFFTPGQPLLAAAPWVFVRGNHEDCQRAGLGWTRLLATGAFDAATPCADHTAPYTVPLDAMKLVVMDDANAPDTSVDANAVPAYRTEFAALGQQTGPLWLLSHRPVWGAVSGPLGIPVGGNATLIEALGAGGIPKPVELLLSGHIHAFEAMNYKDKAPPQIIIGGGGDKLDDTPKDLKGAIFQGSSGVSVKDGLSIDGFGFLLLTKAAAGWDIQLYDQDGAPVRKCAFAGGRVDCPAPAK